ncbi:MAG: hypothetical protein JHC83_10105 [Thermoleophilia bacterium]|nr:hypothetical protein [Thermoleophilia bacterium]
MKRPLLALVALVATAFAAAPATAATVSGTLKSGKGYTIVVVQSNGKAKKLKVTSTKGTFSVTGVTLSGASLNLISSTGQYWGPVVLAGSGTKVYETIKGSGNLALGTVTLKTGYAVAVAPKTRYQTGAAYSVKAAKGKPVGASKLGRVKVGNGTSTLAGYNGPGKDADLDGIPGAFDIDDNGNLILDNVDRTGRAGKRLALVRAFGPALRDICPTPDQPQPAGCTPPTLPASGGGTDSATTEFKLFSNFKLTGATSINANIAAITDLNPLIAAAVPTTVTLATQVIGGATATLDCLGNAYCASHTVGSATYPLVNFAAATFTGTYLDLVTGSTGDAQISPGAAPADIGAGDAFIEMVGASSYPGTLNFVFNTAPALVSYNVGSGVQMVSYDASGVTATGMSQAAPITLAAGATSLTVTFWRPQREALSTETGTWTDIGGLTYRADTPNAPLGSTKRSCVGAYSAATSNGTAVATTATSDGVLDPALDAQANVGNTISWTIDLATCFDWSLMASGTPFDLDIQAVSVYGDNAARKLFFKKG